MRDQVIYMNAVSKTNKVHVVEIAPPSSLSTSDKLLRRIATLLFLLCSEHANRVRLLGEFGLHHGDLGSISRRPV